MKYLMVLILTFSLTGCLSTSGESAYTVKPIELESGEIICCDVEVNNTKDYEKLKMKLVIAPDGTINFELNEDGVDGSTPAMIQAESNSKLINAVLSIAPVSK